jgi:hypothetical protein
LHRKAIEMPKHGYHHRSILNHDESICFLGSLLARKLLI